MIERNSNTAYIIGASIGDGNLSNPNGRAYRLRITCDNKYPDIIEKMKKSLSKMLPNNKVGVINRKDNCVDLSCYSNKLPEILGWLPENGPKNKQKIVIPNWIFNNKTYSKSCLRGLFETDGCIYFDRGYLMVNFVNKNIHIIDSVERMLRSNKIEFKTYKTKEKTGYKYTIRITKNAEKFLKKIKLEKKTISDDTTKPKIVVILGPTSSGKSDLGVKLAKKFNGEIVSADSRQVYKDLDLGSGKITKKEMRGVPHHLLDVVSPYTVSASSGGKVFSVADFQKKAYRAIDDVLKRGKLPIIVGGTAFYIQSIVDGLVLPEVPKSKKFHSRLMGLSLEELQYKLKRLSPDRYKEIDVKNKVRLIRAIEIASVFKKFPKIKKDPQYEVLQIGVTVPREDLHDRIKARLNKRMNAGMLEEAEQLHEKGLSWKRMEEMGLEYRYMAQHLQGKISEEKMLEEIDRKSRQFAKRQMSWFKKDKRIKWFLPTDHKRISSVIKSFLE